MPNYLNGSFTPYFWCNSYYHFAHLVQARDKLDHLDLARDKSGKGSIDVCWLHQMIRSHYPWSHPDDLDFPHPSSIIMRRRHCQIYPSGSYFSAIFVAVFHPSSIITRRRHCQIYPSGPYLSAIFIAVFPLTPFAPLRLCLSLFSAMLKMLVNRRHRQNMPILLQEYPSAICRAMNVIPKGPKRATPVERRSYLLSSSVLEIFSLELQNSECIAMMHHEPPMLKPTPFANDLLSVVRLVANVRFIVLAISHLPITHSAGSSQFRQLPLASTHVSEEERWWYVDQRDRRSHKVCKTAIHDAGCGWEDQPPPRWTSIVINSFAYSSSSPYALGTFAVKRRTSVREWL